MQKKKSTPGPWRQWWRKQSPVKQDRFAGLVPLVTIAIFMVVVLAAFAYLRLEEHMRDEETLTRDASNIEQVLRLRLQDRHEQLQQLASDISLRLIDSAEFLRQAEALSESTPELMTLTWTKTPNNIWASYLAFDGAKNTVNPNFVELVVPIRVQRRVIGQVKAQFNWDVLLRQGIPLELANKYALSIVDEKNQLLAGEAARSGAVLDVWAPWRGKAQRTKLPINLDHLNATNVSSDPGGLYLLLQGFRTSQSVVATGLIFLVVALSLLTIWMLAANWRYNRQRSKTQEALRNETNFRRAMENSMPTGMRALDMRGRITYVNAAFCQMTGWKEADLVGQLPPYVYWPKEDHEHLMATLAEELKGNNVESGIELSVQRSNGTRFDARMYVSALIDSKGVQSGWMASMTDITEPKRIREELTAAYTRFTTILEGLDTSVSVTALGGDDLLFANKAYRDWFGATAKAHLQLLSQATNQISTNEPGFVHTQSPDSVDDLAGFPTSEVVASSSESLELYVQDQDQWFDIRTRYLNWVDGRLAQMLIATDITDRKKSEIVAAQQAERAQSASHLITMGEMASSVAHELNQPLSAIANYCNGMRDRVQAGQIQPDELIAALEKTSKQAVRAGQIIERIRSFVKRSEPTRSPTDPAQMVSEAVEIANIAIQRRQVNFSSHIAARLPRLSVDPILIEQVLVNLIKNASESIDNCSRLNNPRTVELHVLPKPQDKVSGIEFAVIDSGQGLSPEVEKRLYDAFFSTKAQGMGIGLNLCRSIVESHSGRLYAVNLYNGGVVVGCRFAFWLPLVAPTLPIN